jgi:hypothetical protein
MSPCSDSVSLRLRYSLKLATECKSLTHYTKGTPSPLLDGLFESPSSRGASRLASRSVRHSTSWTRQGLTLAFARIYFILSSFESRRSCVAPRKNQKPIKQGLRLFVCMRFQDLFHSPSGVLFAFPSRYWFTIGRSRVFSLGGWAPHLQTGFHVSRPTCRRPSSTLSLSRTGLSPSVAGLSRPLR